MLLWSRLGAGGASRRSGDGGRRAVGRPATRRPPRGRGGHAGPGPRVRGRAVLRPGLAHHGGDGRHRHAPAQAARLGLVRDRRPVDRQGDAVHERRRLRPLRPAAHGGDRRGAHRRRAGRRPRRAARARAAQPGQRGATVRIQVDAHSELMGQYPWGFDGVVPRASDNAPDTGAYAGGRLVFRDTGQLPGEAAPHSYTAMVGSDREPVRGAVGPGHYGPNGMGRTCVPPRIAPAPMPKDCDDGPFGKGTGGRLTYELKLPAGGSKSLWIGVAGSDESPADARSALRKLTRDPARALREKQRTRKQLARWTQLWLPGDPQLQDSIEWGKQNLADLTQEATGLDLRWTNQGKEWTHVGSLARMRWIGAGYPDYPWLFGVDGEYTAHAWSRSASSRRSRTTCARCATSPTSSAPARASSSTRSCPTARSGSAATVAGRMRTAPSRTTSTRTRSSSSRPRWRWSGAGPGTTASATRCSTSWAVASTTWPRSSTTTTMAGRRATATWSGPGWARRSSTTPSTTSARSTTTPTWRGPRA